MYALEMQNIGKEFPGVRALSDVSLRVRRGTIHALLGENGAGKSTLMKILDGIYPAGSFTGEIQLSGKPVHFRSPHDARVKGIGYVPQEIQVLENLTVAENIFLGNWTAGRRVVVDFPRLYERAQRLLDEYRINLDAQFTRGSDAALGGGEQCTLESLDHLWTVNAFFLFVIFKQGFEFADHKKNLRLHPRTNKNGTGPAPVPGAMLSSVRPEGTFTLCFTVE